MTGQRLAISSVTSGKVIPTPLENTSVSPGGLGSTAAPGRTHRSLAGLSEDIIS